MSRRAWIFNAVVMGCLSVGAAIVSALRPDLPALAMYGIVMLAAFDCGLCVGAAVRS